MRFDMMARGGAALALALAVGGCLGGGQDEAGADASQNVRASVVTAPADLQLLCASEAADRFDVASDAVLPVASRQTEEGPFEVDLSLDGDPATCVVDDEANIISLERGSPGESEAA